MKSTKLEHVNVLIISENKSMAEVIRFLLEYKFRSNIGIVSDSAAGLAYLKGVTVFPQIIIYDYQAESYLVEDFIMYLRQSGKDVHVAVLFDAPTKVSQSVFKDFRLFHPIKKDKVLGELVSLIFELFGKINPLNTSEYVRLHLDAASMLDGISNYLHVKLNDDKYIKLFREEDKVEEFDLQKYKDRKLEYFYLTRPTCDWLIAQLNKQLYIILKTPGRDVVPKNFKFIVRSPEESPEKKFEQKIIRICDEFHVDEDFKNEVLTMIDKIYTVITRNPSVKNLLEKIKKDKEKYSYMSSRIQLISFITCIMARTLEWHSKATLNKLIYASIIHDITIFNNDKFTRLGNLEELNSKEKEIYINHPRDANQLLKTAFTNAPPETGTLILQHHEKPDGTGFPGGIADDHISPLSALFIIGSDFATYYLNEAEPDIEDFLLKAEKRYDYPTFRRVMMVFRKLDL